MQIMKMITAVVRPFKLDELRQAIAQLGVQGVTVTEVYEAQFGPRAKVEIAVASGKQQHDKREAKKKADAQREIRRAMSDRRKP